MRGQNALAALFILINAHLSVAFDDGLSFKFDYKPPGQPFQIPTTEQCETLHIKWDRGDVATGPDPIAPYFLRVYTSITDKPLVVQAGNGPENEFNFTLPFDFAPRSVYQICMVDAHEHSGGCQDQYTVIPSSGTPTCSNATFPPTTLNVDFTVDGSSDRASTNGFFDQCSSLHVTPNEGKPPYTLTIAPSLRPSFNITTNKRETLSWQIALSWGANFWISMSDSTGLTWSAGPLHSGGPGSTECLALTKTFSERQIAGASVGSLIAGCLLALLLVAFFHLRARRRPAMKQSQLDPDLVEPVTPYPVAPSASPSAAATTTFGSSPPPSRSNTREKGLPSVPASSAQAVYVYHEDGGRPDVPLVVELPPRYRNERQSVRSESPVLVIGSCDDVSEISSPDSMSAHPLVSAAAPPGERGM